MQFIKNLDNNINLFFKQPFKKASDHITGQKYSTLSFSVPVYNYLLDKIEDELENNENKTIKKVCKLAEKKIKSYYPTTDGDVYIIATSKFSFIY